MPVINKHACRLLDPGLFQEGTYRTLKSVENGVEIVVAKRTDTDRYAIQSYKYSVDVFTPEEARRKCLEKHGEFHESKKLSLYIKEVLRAGNYVYNIRTQSMLNIDVDYLDNMVDDTRKAGIKPYIPLDHNVNPEDNRGWVLGFYRDGSSLYALMNVLDTDTDQLVETGILADASVSILHNYVDRYGNRYDNVIDEISITNTPFIKDMGSYIKMSESSNDKTILSINMLEEKMTDEVNQTVDETEVEIDLTDNAPVVEDVVETEEVKSIKLFDRIQNFFDTTTKLTEVTKERDEIKTQLSEKDTEIEGLKTQLSELSDKMLLIEKDKLDESWSAEWNKALSERKVIPADEDMYRMKFSTAEELSEAVENIEPRQELTDAVPEVKVESNDVVGVTPEVVAYLMARGMSREEIEKFKS